MADEPRIVAGVASMFNTGSLGTADQSLQRTLEAADVQAVLDCLAAGVSIEDGEKIREVKRQYREAALAKFNG
jgi:hypothetical protein